MSRVQRRSVEVAMAQKMRAGVGFGGRGAEDAEELGLGDVHAAGAFWMRVMRSVRRRSCWGVQCGWCCQGRLRRSQR